MAPTLVFSFGSHVAMALVGVLVVPVFLRQLGAEGYGLVTFYVVLQGWTLLLDVGLSPALARQLSRYRAGALCADDALGLMRAAETIFLGAGVIAGGLFFFAAPWVGRHWLGPSNLAPDELTYVMRLIGALLVFRWLASLYQAALVGLEHQTSANAVALFGLVMRSAGAIAALALVSPSPAVFFVIQTAVTVAEVVACRLLLSRALPSGGGAGQAWRLLSKEFSFAAGLTASALVAMAINQADKLALSHVLPLGQFGVFGLVVSVCSGISMVVPPFVQAFQPRLTLLLAQGRRPDFIHVYRLAIAFNIAIVLALAGAIAAQPEMVVFAWTGNRTLGVTLAPTLSLYALGTGINAFLFAPFVLQYAQGLVRLHLIGNLIFGAVWIPTAVWSAFAFGTIGTGLTWLCGNLLFLVIWAPFIHRRLLSTSERKGLGSRAGIQTLPPACLLVATRLIDPSKITRWEALAVLGAISLAIVLLASLLSGDLRAFARRALVRAPSAE